MDLLGSGTPDTTSYPSLKLALDGLERRHEVLANNVANLKTPGFQAKDVDFRHVLSHMDEATSTELPMTKTSDLDMEGTPALSGFDPWAHVTEPTGQGPELQDQMVKISETSLQYGAITQAVSQCIGRYKSVLEGH